MLAVKFFGIGDVRTVQADMVEAAPGQALVKIIYGGVCGSDLHIYREGMFVAKLEETMGHEFIGTVAEAPEGSGFRKGDLVVGDPRVTCGQCHGCKAGDFHRCATIGFIGEVSPGGFAEYLAIEPERLIKLDAKTDPKQGVLVEPLAVAIHACGRIVQSGLKDALVLGAGPIGLLIAYMLKHEHGFERVAVSDIDDFRLEHANKIGVDLVMKSAGEAAGQFNCMVDTVGLDMTLNDALGAIRPGGYLYISAIYEKLPVADVNLIVGRELTIVGNNGYTFDDLKEAARLLNVGMLDFSWLVTRILPAREAADGFKLLTAEEKQDLKILIAF